MSRVRFNGHIYEIALHQRLKWHWRRFRGIYDTPKPLLVSHGTGCCDYWITDPEMIARVVQDGEF